MTWYFMQTSACNRKKSLGLPFTIVTLLGTALLTSVFDYNSSSFNFMISDSGVLESRHSSLRDIQPQSCRLGTYNRSLVPVPADSICGQHGSPCL